SGLTQLLALLPALGAGAATNVTCAKCDDVAHGFASLNGGTTGGKGGRIVTATSHAELVAYANATEPLIIRVEGELTSEPRGGQRRVHPPEDYNGKSEDWDGIQVDKGTNLWIDHVTLSPAWPNGLMDLRRDTDYVTGVQLPLLVAQQGVRDRLDAQRHVISKMTINDNFFNSTNQLDPSADNLLMCHMYNNNDNNYFLNVTSYGNYARGHTALLVETHLDVDGGAVFNATDYYYSYSLKD
ncbi:Pectate lyase A, partial [Colletotrichum shisoi]